jgi:hypothetical protein
LQSLAGGRENGAAVNTGNSVGSTVTMATMTERKAKPKKTQMKTISVVRPAFNLPIMVALLRAAIADSPVTTMR